MLDIKLSVRTLVEFICRSGNIDSSSSSLRDPNAMQEGIKAHQKFQKDQSGDYKSELPLAVSLPYSMSDKGIKFNLVISGRVDGIWTSDDKTIMIDEIKSTYRNTTKMNNAEYIHLAQARCYAYIYALENKFKKIGIRIVYISLQSGHKKFFVETFTISKLKKWFYSVTDAYAEWCFLQIDHINTRNSRIKELSFPFEYRDGQARLVKGVYQSILRSKRLFIEAPTGVGKTISTIFPGVVAMGENLISRIFYLTAKTITRTVAADTVKLLSPTTSPYLKTIIITAKEKICPLDNMSCNPKDCPYALGHYDRINAAISDIVENEWLILPETISEYAKRHMVCPFEFTLDIAYFMDIVICDYNYVFDPDVCLKRFFSQDSSSTPDIADIVLSHNSSSTEKEPSNYLFLIDEAHNLVSRANQMYSAQITLNEFTNMRRIFKNLYKDIRLTEKNASSDSFSGQLSFESNEDTNISIVENDSVFIEKIKKDTSSSLRKVSSLLTTIINKLNDFSLSFPYESTDADSLSYNRLFKIQNDQVYLLKNDDIVDFVDLIKRLYLNLDKLLSDNRFKKALLDSDKSAQFTDFYFSVRTFFNTSSLLDDKYFIYMLSNNKNEFELCLKCMEPDRLLNDHLLKARCSVFFSATLLPIKYFKEQLAGRPEDYCIYAPSPFNSSKRLVMVADDVSTKYTRRTPAEYSKISQYIIRFISAKNGNYIVFFPSYKMLNELYNIMSADIIQHNSDKISFYCQEPDMNEDKREEFLENFNIVIPGETKIGFCVLGGIFSEGIDLTGERLIGVAIVGNGLPMVCTENELYKNYFDKKNHDGFSYSYTYPGMNKVTQAGGRLIRTSDDIGAVLLLDERFLRHEYDSLFPQEWLPYNKVNLSSMSSILSDFWNKW